jgi:hypothetical protein
MFSKPPLTLDRAQVEWAILGLVALVAAGVVLAAAYLPPALDWDGSFCPASRAMVAGRSPYEGTDFVGPPWALLPLLPYAGDVMAGRAALFVLALVVYALVAVSADPSGRTDASPVAMGLFLVSPPVIHSLWNSNLEWLVLLGLLLPPRWGLLLVVIKPQVGAGVAVWWVAEVWREGGWRAVVRTVWPVTAALGVSLLVFGFWPRHALHPPGLPWNASLWPWSLPVGLGLLAYGIWKRQMLPALAAAPFCSPFVLLHAWTGAVLALVGRTWALALVVGGLWGLVLLAAL